jgi:ACS family hexuronate transporter-like MFS transporter
VALAAAAHQGWSANLFTLTSDMFPRRAVGSVVGIGGMLGAVGGMVIALVVGAILEATGSYALVFVMASLVRRCDRARPPARSMPVCRRDPRWVQHES